MLRYRVAALQENSRSLPTGVGTREKRSFRQEPESPRALRSQTALRVNARDDRGGTTAGVSRGWALDLEAPKIVRRIQKLHAKLPPRLGVGALPNHYSVYGLLGRKVG